MTKIFVSNQNKSIRFTVTLCVKCKTRENFTDLLFEYLNGLYFLSFRLTHCEFQEYKTPVGFKYLILTLRKLCNDNQTYKSLFKDVRRYK